MSSLATFNSKIAAFASHIESALVVPLQKKIALEALSRTVQKTPVLTGRARGAWNVSLSGPNLQAGGKSDIGGGNTVSRGAAVIDQVDSYSEIWIGNNVEYIIPLEYGSSQQAPRGMLRLTLQELSRMFP